MMISKALIGYTGFVGGNLDRQMNFTHRYNSKNIGKIDGHEFDLLVCAGAPGSKWLANRDSGSDKKTIDELESHLAAIKAKKFILISTVDVYPEPIDVDETSAIDISACQAYGRHRLQLERFVSANFDTLVIRLPGLFGDGLKKNIVYDFLNDNCVEQINPAGKFQFYYLEHIAHDISVALKHDLKILNITSEPVGAGEVSEICLGKTLENVSIDTPPARYDYKSAHADKFGGRDGYLYSKNEVLSDLRDYVTKVRT